MPSGGSAHMTSGDFTGEGSATSRHLICMIIVHVLLTCTFIQHSRAQCGHRRVGAVHIHSRERYL